MSKKIMLLALAAVSAAMFALPAAASATWSVDSSTADPTVLKGTTTTTGKLTAAGEPTITCEGPDHITVTYNQAASATAGTIHIEFTNCHIVVLGFTIACKTSGAAVSNTITVHGTFQDVTIGASRGVAVSPEAAVVQCGSTKPITIA